MPVRLPQDVHRGYLFGGHEGHSGNNNRFCIDKNLANDCELHMPLSQKDRHWMILAAAEMSADSASGPRLAGAASSSSVNLMCAGCGTDLFCDLCYSRAIVHDFLTDMHQ